MVYQNLNKLTSALDDVTPSALMLTDSSSMSSNSKIFVLSVVSAIVSVVSTGTSVVSVTSVDVLSLSLIVDCTS